MMMKSKIDGKQAKKKKKMKDNSDDDRERPMVTESKKTNPNTPTIPSPTHTSLRRPQTPPGMSNEERETRPNNTHSPQV